MADRGAPRLAASQSFTAAEIEWMDQLFRTILRGGDVAVIARARPEVRANLTKKIQIMKRTLERQRARRAQWERDRAAED